MMDEGILKLKLSLEEKTPTLLLGAGFSYGARNEVGDQIPLGTDLVEKLYNYMFIENPPSKEILNEDKEGAKAYKEMGDLKGLCGLLRDENRLDERNEFLTNIFKGATVDKKSKLYNIGMYKWDKIFTLNIDCLLEYIFDRNRIPYKVWNRDNDDRQNNDSSTLIIKLHGCVENKKAGYIFDEYEYIDFINDDNCFSRDFGYAYSKNDIIFIGTEFQEEDLKIIMDKYNSAGYDTDGNNYYFITPKINNVSLKRQIKNTPNYYWIKWKTEEFFEFLYSEVVLEKDTKKILQEKGLVSIDDLYKEKLQGYESKLYAGYESIYEDFFSEWDIIRPGLLEFEKKIIYKGENIVAAIIGKSYVGKSCAAKRILVDLRKSGFLTFEFKMRSSEYINLFLDYLHQLPQGTKVAVLFEEASFYFNLLYSNLICRCPDNIKQLIIITSDTNSNYFSKRDILESKNCVVKFFLNEEISWIFSDAIYLKLKQKHWLNKPEICGSRKYEIKKYAYKINDIIEFLYNISYGKGFESHYQDMFDLLEKNVNFKYLQALAILGMLGIGSVPTRILPSLIKGQRKNFNFKKFKEEYDEVLLISEHRIKIRCLRLIQKTIILNLKQKEISVILNEIVRQTQGQFNEGDINEWSEIFQKSLTVKRILRKRLLDLSIIRELLNDLEKYGEKYSFYWIQRGIVAQKENDFDLADHYFREGIKIRPTSYQARHALSKNLMERAVEQALKGNSLYARFYMDEGNKEMKKIIENPAYSRGYKYSLHTFIDMNIKFSNASERDLLLNEIQYIESKIIDIPNKEMDPYILAGIKRFLAFCQLHGYEKLCEPIIVKNYENIPLIKDVTEDDYLVENLDWED